MTLSDQITAISSHRNRWGKIVQLGWYSAAFFAIGVFIASIPGFIIIGTEGIINPRFSANPSPLIGVLTWITISGAMASGLVSLFLALLLFRRGSGERMAMITSCFLLAYGVIMAGPLEALEPFFPGIAGFTQNVLMPAFVPFGLILFAVFPDGRFVPRWIRWVVLATFLAIPFSLFWTERYTQSPLDFSQPVVMISTGMSIVLAVAIWFSILYAQVYRYRHNSTLEQKQQTKWVVYGIGIWLTLQVASAIPWTYSYSLAPGTPIPLWLAAASIPWIISIAVIPITLAIAVLRYRLLEIDFLINRTLVYGALTASVIGSYVLIVGGAGLVIQSNLTLAGLLISAVVAGVIFRPMRAFFQRGVDSLMYGKTGAPHVLPTHHPPERVLSGDLHSQLEENERPTRNIQAAPMNAVVVSHHDRWLRFARAGWYVWATIVLGILILSVTAQISTLAAESQGNLTAQVPSWLIAGASIAGLVARTAASLISLVLAGVLYLKRSQEGLVLLTSYFLLVNAVVMAPLTFLEPYWPGAQGLTYSVIQPIFFAPLLIAFLSVFPTGRFVPAWTRWLLAGAILYAPVGAFLFTAQAYSKPTPIFILAVLIWFVLIFTGLYAQIVRYRRVSNAIERQQTKWVIFGFSVAAFLALLLTAWTIAFNRLSPDTSLPWWAPIANMGWVLAYIALPISLAFAVMRYRLFDIDLIINRTLVYGILTASVVGLYVLIVGGAGLVIHTNLTLAGMLITAALAGVFYRSMRAFLQRGADRVIPPLVPAREERVPDHPRSTIRTSQPERSEVRSWGRVLKPLWIVAAALSIAILLASLPGYLVRTPIGNLGERLVFEPTPLILAFHHLNSLISIFSAVLSLSLAVLLFVKKSGERMGLFLSFYLLAHGILFAGPIEMLEPFWPDATLVNSFVLLPLLFGPGTAALICLFPDGRFVPDWSRWLIPASLVALPAGWLRSQGATFINPGPQLWVFSGFLTILSLGVLFALLYIPIYRYRYVSTPEQRQQTRWVVYGFFLLFVFFLISTVPWTITLNLPPGSPIPWWLPVGQTFWFLATAILPVTLTVTVMRYRLYEIDILINRTLVFGALSGSVIAIYALMVGAFGVLFQIGGNLVISLIATGLVAVLFQPLRARLQRGINRMMYGERDDPATVFARLGDLLEASASPQETLPGLVRTIAQTLKLPYAAIELGKEGDREVVAAYGNPSDEPERFALVYQSEVVGCLIVAPRAQGEGFSLADRQLLENIARQAGAVAHAVRLTNELQRSRLRLVTAREEERRRLRRDLHDELGPQLASQALIIEALEKRLRKDPASAAQLLEELKKQSQRAVEDVRQIVYGLRPPALDHLGLVGAVQVALAAYQRSGVAFHLQTTEEMPPLPAAVEVAIYRIIQEAATNVIRHAEAKHCEVRMDYQALHDVSELRLVIQDDGVGIKDDHRNGVGLNSMRERAAELGGDFRIVSPLEGGARVSVRLPISREES